MLKYNFVNLLSLSLLGIKRVRGAAVPDGLPKINPNSFARNMKQEHEQNMREIKAKAQKEQTEEEMYVPSFKTKDKLYDGFTKEEKGRYQYLKERKNVIPEQKYSFPILSSWEYGWKLDEQFKLQRPKHARTRMIQDSFYTRNTVPTLEGPSDGYVFERSKTILT